MDGVRLESPAAEKASLLWQCGGIDFNKKGPIWVRMDNRSCHRVVYPLIVGLLDSRWT